MNIPSKLIDDAVNEFASLPGIGKKTALRLALHLLKEPKTRVQHWGETIVKMRRDVKFCKKCHNISDEETCSICQNPHRKQAVICVVESLRDLIAIENTDQYHGTYHVLGGVISPIDGVGPDDLNIETLINRVKENEASEVIMALNPTIEGDTTIFYLSKKINDLNVNITTIARGVAFGGELEYVDEMTLARSIATRRPYNNYISEMQ
jgi:recombination protein RecR